MDDMTETAEEVKAGAPEWMVTFGDLMTLLLCFFVLLLSFSETDRAKYKEVAGSLEKAFGIQRKTPAWDSPKGQSLVARNFDTELQIVTKEKEIVGKEMEEDLDDMFRMKLDNEGIEIAKNGEEIIIRLLGGTSFESGKAAILPMMTPPLEKVGVFLKKARGDIVIAGHTDNVPVNGGPFQSNLRLSLARSAAVAEFFIGRGYLSPQRVVTMGFGKYRPIDTNDTAKGREKNRRVEIVMTTVPKPAKP